MPVNYKIISAVDSKYPLDKFIDIHNKISPIIIAANELVYAPDIHSKNGDIYFVKYIEKIVESILNKPFDIKLDISVEKFKEHDIGEVEACGAIIKAVMELMVMNDIYTYDAGLQTTISFSERIKNIPDLYKELWFKLAIYSSSKILDPNKNYIINGLLQGLTLKKGSIETLTERGVVVIFWSGRIYVPPTKKYFLQ